MKSLDYMRQILPNEFNWNILNQLFEEDGVELNEVAEKIFTRYSLEYEYSNF